jgi:hypothetical protein
MENSISAIDIIADAEDQVKKPKVDLSKVFFPTWDNRPPEQPAVLSLNGTPILTHQNVSAIIAAQGMGKTSVVEGITAAHLSPEADGLGFTVNSDYKGLICCDFERTDIDVWNSFYRIAKRANLSYGSDFSKVRLVGMRSVPRVAERIATIEMLLENHPCSILILDGAGDLVTDVNDLGQAIECRIWMRELTVKYDLSIFTTLHPNPGQVKPRGHIGSEIVRECEGVMIIQNQDGVRTITTDFEHGKNRNNAPVSSAFQWNDESSMFLSCDLPYGSAGGSYTSKKLPEAKDFSEHVHALLLNQVFSKDSQLKSGEFLSNLMTCWDETAGGQMKPSRAKTFHSWYILNDFIESKKGNKGNVTLNSLTEKVLYYKSFHSVGQVVDS